VANIVSQGRQRPAGGLARRQAPRLAGRGAGHPEAAQPGVPPRRSRGAGRTASENSGRARRKSHRLRGAAGPAGLAAGAAPGRRRGHHRAGRSSCCAASERGASYGAPQLGPGAPPWTLAGRQGACACGAHAAPRCPAREGRAQGASMPQARSRTLCPPGWNTRGTRKLATSATQKPRWRRICTAPALSASRTRSITGGARAAWRPARPAGVQSSRPAPFPWHQP